MRVDYENLVKTYVNCCYATDSQQTFYINFYNILHKDVRLQHQTEQNIPFVDCGRKKLVKQFQNFIYNHKSKISNPTFEITDWKDLKTHKEGLKLQVIAQETLEGADESREIHETTYFKFKKNSKGKIKISHIQSYFDKIIIRST